MDFSLVLVFMAGIAVTQGAQVEVDPREVLVLPGQNVTIMCRLAVPLQYCRVDIPGMKPLNLNEKLSYAEVTYYGNGLSAGQCGFTVNKITDRNNGQVGCMLGVLTEATESVGYVQLVVARAPKVPEMDISRGPDAVRVYRVNDILQASCIVRDGRPVANISWYLDDEPLLGNELSMPTVIDIAKENLESKLQNLTRMLQASDNGKHLKCVATHPAYPNGRSETSRQLDVKFGPLPQGELDKFGYTLGQPGKISVIIQANPRPMVEWDIGDERLKESYNDQTGRIVAEPVKELGLGQYEVSLSIAAIQKHDTEKTFILRAYNDMGTHDYFVKISTSPEPEGLELGLGGVIGIVIAVLVVLLFVFVIIFAKITGRWCFSGTQDTRNLGESSDTESAEGRHREAKNFPPIKLTSFFKKKQDKVSSTEEIEPKRAEDEARTPLEGDLEKENEPKEGALVYAELDLVSPQGGPPIVKNDNDRTEYAEIVYTPQEAEKKS